MERARELILRFGWNSTAYQILNPGILHWFSTCAPAVVGFVPRAKTWVAAGAPICPLESLSSVTDEFEYQAASANCGVCYVAAGNRLNRHFDGNKNHAGIVIGTQPAWDPHAWPDIVRTHASLRAQLARARNKGVVISEQMPKLAQHDPELRCCLTEWLASRRSPPLHFIVEPSAIHGVLDDRRILVARRGGHAIAYLLASPVPARQGYLVEQIIRSDHAPNGTAELLVDAIMHTAAASGCRYVTLGLIPLAEQPTGVLEQNPFWLRALMTWARAHGRRFYYFKGLEQFKRKLCPTSWETIYAISNRGEFTPASLYAMLSAFSDGPLPWMVVRALARAIGMEGRWLAESLSGLVSRAE